MDKNVQKTQLNLSIVQANHPSKPNQTPKARTKMKPFKNIPERAPKSHQVAAQSLKVALPSSIDPGPGHIVPLAKATLGEIGVAFSPAESSHPA